MYDFDSLLVLTSMLDVSLGWMERERERERERDNVITRLSTQSEAYFPIQPE